MEHLTIYNCPKFSFCNRCFHGKIVNIHDGDILTAIVQVHRGEYYQMNFRFYGINAPETSGNERSDGLVSKYRVVNFFTGIPIDTLQSYKYSQIRDIFNNDKTYTCFLECANQEDKYGRVLARIYKDDSKSECINDILINENLAVKY